MSISVSIVAGSQRTTRTDQGVPIRKNTLSITGMTAGADNTVAHTLPFKPTKLSYRPSKNGTTPGGWSETSSPDGTNLYITVNTNGSTAGLVDVEE